ncbi:MAG: PAS domain S-box protein [Dehalococcoidia bacterium]|nr:PAS domain S-box protein [Dehalococcoidia bacterium]
MAPKGEKLSGRPVKKAAERRRVALDFSALGRDLADAIQTGVYIVQDRKFAYVNPYFEKLTGYSNADLIGKKATSFINKLDRASVRKKAVGSLKGRRGSRPYEYRFIRKDGRLMWVLERVFSIDYMGRKASLGSFVDIDDRKQLEEDLSRSEERYRNILEQMYDSYYEVDITGKFTFVNNSVCINLGYTSDEMVGRDYSQFVPEEDISKLFVTFNRCFTSGIPNRGLVHGIYRKNGSMMVVESSVDLRRNERGEPIGFRSIVRDVTERTKLEEELQKLAAVVWHSNELINMATMDGKMSYLNNVGSRILGIDPEEVEKFNIQQVIPEHFKHIVNAELLPALIKGGAWEGELQYINLKTGQITDVYANAFTVEDPRTGGPLFMANVSRDITLRKKAEAALKESEERYRALFDRSMDLVYIRNMKGDFLDANPAGLRLLGYTEDDVPSLNIASVLSPDQFPQTMETLKELRETGTQLSPTEYKVKCKDGRLKYVETKESVIYRDGKPYAVQGIRRDITERKLAEKMSIIRRDLAISLNTLMTLKQALTLCLDAAIHISSMESGVIYMVDEKTGGLRLFERQGFTAEMEKKYSMFGPDTPNTRLILKGKPLYLKYSELTPPFDQQFSLQDLNVMAVVPIKHEGKVVACLILASSSLDCIPEVARNSLEMIAAEIGSAITRIKYREQLQNSEQRYRFIADNTSDVIWAMDRKLRYTFISPSVIRQRGYTPDEAMSLNITRVITPDFIDALAEKLEAESSAESSEQAAALSSFTQEMEMYRKDGSTFWTESSITILRDKDGRFDGLLGVTRDVSERRRLEQTLEKMATHDFLTGLPNRVLLIDRFSQAVALAQRNKHRLAIMSLDIDNFKPINDGYGHSVGDHVLIAVGKRLAAILRSSDTVARIGGDEFILMTLETNHDHDTSAIADKILDAFKESFTDDGHQFQLSPSMGIAIYPEDGQDLDILMKKADETMYRAKKSGGNRFVFCKDVNAA